jgi:hypothetical protein
VNCTSDDLQLGDYDAVLSLVENDIIGQQQCLSMETLVTRYISNSGTKQIRCQDIIHAVSKGKFLTLKHASLVLGLHRVSGQKLPIKLHTTQSMRATLLRLSWHGTLPIYVSKLTSSTSSTRFQSKYLLFPFLQRLKVNSKIT